MTDEMLMMRPLRALIIARLNALVTVRLPLSLLGLPFPPMLPMTSAAIGACEHPMSSLPVKCETPFQPALVSWRGLSMCEDLPA